jgi:alpha-D-xyloside xylohydrolase
MYTLESHLDSVILASGERRLRIAFVTPSIARVTLTEGKPFSTVPSLIVVNRRPTANFTFGEEPGHFILATSALTLRIDRQTGAIAYLDAHGKLLTREPERGGKWLTPKPIFRNVFQRDEATAFAPATELSVDGARSAAALSNRLFDRNAFEARLDFVFAPDEALFGFGSHEEGFGNLRGHARELYQQNMKAVVPVLVSTRGYAVLVDCGSLMTFHDDALGSYWWADTVDELDFYFIAGDRYDALTAGLHHLTGPAPLPPKWLFGFAQSKERYVNAAELVAVVREYRRREIPLDLIVLDWKSWPNGSGWGQKSLDPNRFPSPAALTAELHALGARLMVSIWPIMTGGCPDQREFLSPHRPSDLMLGNQATYNAFLPEARELYWQQAEQGLFAHGVDAWWCDCTEPFEADWSGAVKPEPHMRLALNTAQSKLYLDPAQINTYSLVHSQGIYEGQRSADPAQRSADPAKRVVNLTRSSYAGQHRYATITWNGDTSATWETLRRSIPEGLNFFATGEPYWTVDIGGFFLANDPALWFWRGDFPANTRGLTPADALAPDPADTGSTDLGFHELYTRWLQFACFLPVFRSHGTDAAREIWRFGEPGTPFYDVIAAFIRLRYRLIPYLYSLAAAVTFHARAMLRAVALEFPSDLRTHDLLDQFLLGPALLVCPVTEPMYFASNSQPLAGVPKTRPVYLPVVPLATGPAWFDFWTSAPHPGGRTITADAPLDRIPLFVRAGSILPLTSSAAPKQFVDQFPEAPIELRVYTGVDAHFTLYEDAGDTYAYEQGAYALVEITWTEQTQQLHLAPRRGTFPELIANRDFTLVFFTSTVQITRQLRYTGQGITLTL